MSGVSNKNTFDDNSFIDAIVERKKQIEYAISAMDASTHPQNFVGRSIYVNLMAENKSVFNKRSRKFLHFRDKRIKNLITLLADDIFWDEIYSKPFKFFVDLLSLFRSPLWCVVFWKLR